MPGARHSWRLVALVEQADASPGHGYGAAMASTHTARMAEAVKALTEASVSASPEAVEEALAAVEYRVMDIEARRGRRAIRRHGCCLCAGLWDLPLLRKPHDRTSGPAGAVAVVPGPISAPPKLEGWPTPSVIGAANEPATTPCHMTDSVAASEDLFRDALAWLGADYGITSQSTSAGSPNQSRHAVASRTRVYGFTAS
jgi:hypothetical protein